MVKDKNKTIYPISLDEIKTQLRIPVSDTSEDTYLTAVSKAATEAAEAYIGKDIAKTINTIKFYDFCGTYVRFYTGGNVIGDQLTSVSYIDDNGDSQTVTPKNVFFDHYSCLVEFNNYIDTDKLTIVYDSGYYDTDDNSICPELIKQAILVQSTQMYQTRSGFGAGSYSPVFEQLLSNITY